MASKMKVVQVSKAKGDFEIVERDIPFPGPGQVRIRVQACGVCHSDLYKAAEAYARMLSGHAQFPSRADDVNL
jgi:D-arabinose 1-dehydrogenase-like Zn-dependent alcohol dehydrogenase